MPLTFSILAGKPEPFYDEYTENIKFCDETSSLEAALKIINDNKLYTYPICRIVITGFSGGTERVISKK